MNIKKNIISLRCQRMKYNDTHLHLLHSDKYHVIIILSNNQNNLRNQLVKDIDKLICFLTKKIKNVDSQLRIYKIVQIIIINAIPR